MSVLICNDCGFDLLHSNVYRLTGKGVGNGMFCRDCYGKRMAKRTTDVSSRLLGPAGADSAATKPATEDAPMNPVYMTAEQVRKYVATWLKFVSTQPMAQPRHFMRIKATLRLPSPKGDNHGKV